MGMGQHRQGTCPAIGVEVRQRMGVNWAQRSNATADKTDKTMEKVHLQWEKFSQLRQYPRCQVCTQRPLSVMAAPG